MKHTEGLENEKSGSTEEKKLFCRPVTRLGRTEAFRTFKRYFPEKFGKGNK